MKLDRDHIDLLCFAAQEGRGEPHAKYAEAMDQLIRKGLIRRISTYELTNAGRKALRAYEAKP